MEINIIIKDVVNLILNIKEISNLIWANGIFQKFHMKKILLFIIAILYLRIMNYLNKKEDDSINKLNNLVPLKKYLLFQYPNKNITRLEYFNISNLDYNYSLLYNFVKIEFKVGFYDDNKILVNPSFLTLYNKLNILCELTMVDSNITIYSLPNIYQNGFFDCIEFFNINEKIRLGIKIIKQNKKIEYKSFYTFSEKLINYKNLKYKNNFLFDPLILIKNYNSLLNNINHLKSNETLKFKKSYLKYPYFNDKTINLDDKEWKYSNIFNNYFCYCIGENCLYLQDLNFCKYYFYLTIIDKNMYVNNKTDYLFVDFIFSELSSDDVYPVFEKMIGENSPVHYLTENSKLYYKYCYLKIDCLKIILVNKKNYIIDGNFLEKYLFLILKLKAVVSGRAQPFNFYTNLFYNLEYVNYIGVGHGVSFFKYFLYSKFSTYGINQNDQILLPPSEKLISVAKIFGWTDKNIIKMNLPRWDNYDNNIFLQQKKVNNSIFIMFTWRELKKKKKISSYYFKNIINIIESNLLYKWLEKKKIVLYFTLHHLLREYIQKYKKKYEKKKYIHYIFDNDISDILSKTNLIISDFSSIIFDQIYRRKPFIIYIPDADDPEIVNLYKRNYYELINSMKNGSIEFENKYFDAEEVVDKTIYYIKNDFKLEEKLKNFYDSFQFKKVHYINIFINYLKNK